MDAGEELALGLAADRLERARRAEWLQRRWNRARSLETWGGRLLNAGGITFYVLFPLLILADPLFDIDVSARTWLLVFGADFTAILVGGFLVFLTRRIQNWLRRWAEANFVEV